MPSSTTSTASGLIKNHLSDELRSEILSGSLKSGERIVGGKWAAQFGVAVASTCEAINSVAHSGFVTKVPVCSARAIHLRETDVGHISPLRGAIENTICPAGVWTPIR